MDTRHTETTTGLGPGTPSHSAPATKPRLTIRESVVSCTHPPQVHCRVRTGASQHLRGPAPLGGDPQPGQAVHLALVALQHTQQLALAWRNPPTRGPAVREVGDSRMMSLSVVVAGLVEARERRSALCRRAARGALVETTSASENVRRNGRARACVCVCVWAVTVDSDDVIGASGGARNPPVCLASKPPMLARR
eukprot:1195990-Prorocentrum_minimum.AAC.6